MEEEGAEAGWAGRGDGGGELDRRGLRRAGRGDGGGEDGWRRRWRGRRASSDERELGRWQFKSQSQDTYHEGYMFPLLVNKQLDFWPEKHVRQRLWMSATEAKEVCQHLWMKEALDVLVSRLSSAKQRKKL